jgi:superfamily II DNA or RNA helicase
MIGLCGPIYERVEAIQLIELDRIATPTIEVVKCNAWRDKFSHLGQQAEINTPAWVLADGEWLKGIYLGPEYELDETGEFKLDRRGDQIQVPGVHLIDVNGGKQGVESRWCLLERRYDCSITTFKERNEYIVAEAASHSARGWPVLIIATRTLHVMILEAMLKKAVNPDLVRILFSAHSSAERDSTFEWLKATPGSILVSPLVKVGVSIDEIRLGIIADFVSNWEVANQLIGRMIRKKLEGPNEAKIIMFNEVQHASYAATSRRLVNDLKKIEGYRWKEVEI